MDASEGIVKFLRGVRATFYFVDGFVENPGDIEEADNISVFVAYRLKGREWQRKISLCDVKEMIGHTK